MTTTVDDRHGPDGRQTGSATYHSPPLDPRTDPDPDGVALSVSVKEFTAIADAARWAPSLHNDQPWRLRRLPDGLAVIEVDAPPPDDDPLGRARTVSCAAALFNAAITLSAHGFHSRLAAPAPGDPTAVGSVRVVGLQRAGDDDLRLAAMITRRRSYQRIYRSHLVAENDLQALQRAAAQQGATLVVLSPAARDELATLTEQIGGPDSGDTLGRSTVLALCTDADARADRIVAGLALQRLLLTATAAGLVAAFTDQALLEAPFRDRVRAVLEGAGEPQVLFRVGRPLVAPAPTTRRPLSDLLI